MSATEELIAAEAGKLNLDEKKTSIAESQSSSSSSSSESTISNHCCSQMRNQFCCNNMPGCYVPAPCFMLPYWGPLCVAPHCYRNFCQPPPTCQVVPHCKCSVKTSKKKKSAKEEAIPCDKTEEQQCKCCCEGKCECCKTGKECEKNEDKTSEKGDGDGEDKEGDDEEEKGDKEEEKDDEEEEKGDGEEE